MLESLESRIAPSTIYGLAPGNVLLQFDSDTPGTIDSTQTITGLGAGETLRGLDFRAASSDLYASSVTTGSAANSLIHTYIIDPETATATLVGTTAAALAGAADVPTLFDFNPVVDRIRYANANDENARLNPNNGALSGNDTDLTPAATTEMIAGGYDRNFVNGPATTLFGINRATSALDMIGGADGVPSPNGGGVATVGPLGVTLSATHDGGFDIEFVTNVAFAALTDAADTMTRLYTVDLATGAATAVGAIGAGLTEIYSIAVAPPDNVKFVNPTTATYVDEDGDRITLKVSKGTLERADLKFAVTANGGSQLRLIDFTDDGNEFASASLAITVRKGMNGDGLANIGFIKARDTVSGLGVDLQNVSVQGDLAQIDAGDSITTTSALGKLVARSLGRYGAATEIGAADLQSDIFGALGSLKIGGDVKDATIHVTGAADADGSIGSIKIAGSLLGGGPDTSGHISATGSIGPVTIGGDVVSGNGDESGKIVAIGAIAGVKVAGSLIGGGGDLDTVPGQQGQIVSSTQIGPVVIGGDLLGGSGDSSASIRAFGAITSVKVGGSLIGGEGNSSASIVTGVGNDLGPVKIGGDVRGGDGSSSGSITGSAATDATPTNVTITGSLIGGRASFSGSVTGELGLVKVGGDVVGGDATVTGAIGGLANLVNLRTAIIAGSVIGGTANNSGVIGFAGNIGSVLIGGDLVGGSISGGGSLDRTGAILGDHIGTVFIAGSMIAGVDDGGGALTKNATVRAGHDIGSITVRGDLVGNDVTQVIISARGQLAPPATGDIAIGKVTIGGRAEQARLLAGWDDDLNGVNGNASIGAVKVAGDWIASSLVAGVLDDGDAALDDSFGEADDQLIPGFDMDTLIARIASVSIKGRVIGTGISNGDHFGFVAQQIGAFKALGLSLARSTTTDAPVELSPLTGDVTVREL
jgi:hypothetical protein